jgi:two-component system, OmpR family, alkaline phosphatase synthesis response regulator PhoP
MAGEQRQILVVEDDEAIATGLCLNLSLAGHKVTAAHDGERALEEVAAADFDMILLDINLPRKNGLEVLQALRSSDNLAPVIVLSARDAEFDKVAALRLGADDYLTKPFALAELLARMDAVWRRFQPQAGLVTPRPAPPEASSQSLLKFGAVVIDLAQRTVLRQGRPVKLTHLEFELLVAFVRHASQVLGRAKLFSMVWGQTAGSPRTVDNFVGQLRKHLEDDPERPRHFVTVRGSGYRFDP